MATQNNINNTVNPFSTTAMTIDPGSSGDSYIQFDINTTGEFRAGVDDTDGDAFLLSQGSALGTNNTFRMSAAGEMNMGLQPLFLAVPSSTLTNVTGDGTIYTVVFGSETTDQGSDYDSSTGIFTAPVAGKYKFVVGLSFTGIVSHSNCPLYFGKNGTGTTDVYDQEDFGGGQDVSGAWSYTGETYVSLAASDTYRAIARFLTGSKVIDITTDSFFAGFLCV
jgi:hypothetical protein